MKKVLVFGDFDLLHPGHYHLLQQAKKFGDELVVAVTPESVIRILKQRAPLFSNKHRIDALRHMKIVSQATLGDKALGSFSVIEKIHPSVICVGHDQTILEKELRSYLKRTKQKITIKRISALNPKTFKSTKLKNILKTIAL